MRWSEQPKRLEAGDALAADDQMVVHADLQGAAGLDDLPGHVDVGAGGGGVAAGVVVEKPSKSRNAMILIGKIPVSWIAGDAEWGRF